MVDFSPKFEFSNVKLVIFDQNRPFRHIFWVKWGQIDSNLTLEHFNGKMSRDFREVKNHKIILYA